MITCLKAEDGNWVTDPDALLDMGRQYYCNLFRSDDQPLQPPLPCLFPEISQARFARISAPPSNEEIKAIINDINGLKAPGKDGFHALFFQKCWESVGEDFCKFIQECFICHNLISRTNETLLVLIPKTEAPVSMKEFRPISLCNVGYKTIAKCLANRIKGLMPILVKQNQTSFVPKRHITDNILILQETVHSMARKSGKKGMMLMKIDLAKAYDRIEWKFLEQTLYLAGFPPNFVAIVMQCVSSTQMQVLWNGGESESFSPSRGLRQGCPLSPYLFTLCVERLSHCIENAVKEKRWKPVNLSPGEPPLSHLFFDDDLVLFAEASPRQAEVVMDCIEAFCSASGEQISKEKSRVLFSKNTKCSNRRDICNRLGIQETDDLGRYLGVPVLHGIISKTTFKYILEKIDRKLTAWKAKTLSLAGRVTLAQSVLNAIPTYAMQTSMLPVSICDDIDRRIRRFVWGSQEGKRKVHLVSWEKVCTAKQQGGLGLRSARSLNLAYMIKLAWSILNNKDDLWVKVMQGKYFHQREGRIIGMKRSNHSSLWKGILKSYPLMQRATVWSIRDGRTTDFWNHPWIDQDTLLKDFSLRSLTDDERCCSVAEMANDQGEWEWSKLNSLLPNDCLMRIAGMEAPVQGMGEDTTIWGLEKDGRFRLKSAYLLAANEVGEEAQAVWKKLWEWKGPNRVKHFLWLVLHNRLLTNHERTKRKLTTDGSCKACNEELETIEHILRKCRKTEGVRKFFKMGHSPGENRSFQQWIIDNINDSDRGTDFGITCWMIWKQRNEEIMDWKTYSEAGLISKIMSWIQVYKQARINEEKSIVAPRNQHIQTSVAWKPPREGWIQIQTDGSVLQNSGKAAAGGLLRDHLGRCLDAFTCNLGSCTITTAELRGAEIGLQRAWERGFRKVELNLDSSTAITIMKNIDDTDHRHGLIATRIGKLLNLNWEVILSHVYREGNFAADFLASKGHLAPFGTHFFDVYDPNLCKWLLYDSMAISMDRSINLMN
ncbi:unnamed protein product [Linum trigynum]|uniref:Reverse transcriptase domain-containing protein n=1 Tax=Linum trigynum TaxID=586398 RepID=A0AAV2D408_9ROSI